MTLLPQLKPVIPALLLGIVTVAGFAPFGLFPLPVLTLALLASEWQHTPQTAPLTGFAFGLGLFLAGVSWVYVSMHDVGGMAAPIAISATALLCVYLALFPALAGFLWRRWRSGAPLPDALLFAGLWTLAEGLRGWLFSGFPWLSLGYTQTPPSPLAGFVPLVGSYGAGFLVTLCAALPGLGGRKAKPLVLLALLIAAGIGLRGVSWTTPEGAPVSVSLLQGNIPQSLKWEPGQLERSLRTYADLARSHPARLTVLPETAIPLLFDHISPSYLALLRGQGELLLGAPQEYGQGYRNAAIGLGNGVPQFYAKHHLVPFGEFVPPGFAWFFTLVRIPMADFEAGAAWQPPLTLAGLRLMPNICYEDLFGEEIIATLGDAGVLVNLSNTAWFGHSLAQPQHLQIARIRALETGRPMLRATNTGMTASINPDGTIAAALPPFTTDALTVSVRAWSGQTPYARAGNMTAWTLALLSLIPAWRRHGKGRT
ncbi:MAG: apolipoprotein N-acyltransferase [Proteobacteria bacterium]|nr:apolipoprotein N-acyltransferase [Pseudomonadota bacterium]HQR04983.1 apolipoprotein N-acyltransferase [Rhodocyclaceae bacterium]